MKNSRTLKTLLVNTPSRTETPAYYFPIGLGYIAAVLRENNYPVQVLDLYASRYSKDEVRRIIKDSDFDVMGISGIITAYKYVKWLVREVKRLKPEAKVVIGGHLGTSAPELLFKHTDVDFIVLNDGEQIILDLYDNLSDPKNVLGICFRGEKRKMIRNPLREPVEDLDSIPFPAYDLFPIEKYVSTSVYNMEPEPNMRSVNLMTHRGCPFRCIFCHNPSQKARTRSTDNVISEVKFLKKKYGVNFMHFSDELFVIDKKWVLDLCKKLKKEKLGIRWSCRTRVNLIDEEIFSEMKSAGCTYVGYGIESASQNMLDAMKKDCTVEQQRKAVKATKKLGFDTYPTFIIGTPGETKETVQESIDFCKELDLIPEFFFMTPFPGTELYSYALNKGLIKDEDKYIDGLGECTELRVNLTDLPDEELIRLKKNAEKQIYAHFIMKHPFIAMKKSLKVLRNYGPSSLFKIIRRRLSGMAAS